MKTAVIAATFAVGLSLAVGGIANAQSPWSGTQLRMAQADEDVSVTKKRDALRHQEGRQEEGRRRSWGSLQESERDQVQRRGRQREEDGHPLRLNRSRISDPIGASAIRWRLAAIRGSGFLDAAGAAASLCAGCRLNAGFPSGYRASLGSLRERSPVNDLSEAAKPSPFGLWNETAVPRPGFPELQDDFTAETAIIGGGFCGLSAALHLAEGGTQPVLLEAEEPGFGASGRNGGQVIAGLKLDPGEMVAKFGRERGEALHRFSAGTADLVFSLIERFQIQCEAHRDGWIQAAYAPKVLAAIERRAGELKARGENVEILDKARMAEFVGTDFYRGGMLDRRSGMVQPFSYARGLRMPRLPRARCSSATHA